MKNSHFFLCLVSSSILILVAFFMGESTGNRGYSDGYRDGLMDGYKKGACHVLLQSAQTDEQRAVVLRDALCEGAR